VPDHRKLLLVSVLVLTAVFFIEHFFLHDEYFFLPDDLPDFISNSPLAIGGLFLALCMMVEYYIVFKWILKQDDTISLFYLAIFGCLIALFSEVIFQFYRQFEFADLTNAERMIFFLKDVLVSTALGGFIAFMEAFGLKYKKTYPYLTTLINIGFFVLFKYSFPYLKDFLNS